MKTNDIIAVSREIGSRLAVLPTGLTRAEKEAKKVQEEFEGIPYLEVWHRSFSDTVYARVVRIIPAPTKDGADLIVATTLPVATSNVYICVLEHNPEKITVVTAEDLINRLLRKDVTIFKKPIKEEMEECLQAMFPDEWDFSNGYLYIHFPEVLVRNENPKDQGYPIYDLFVRIKMNETYTSILGSWEGKRTSLTTLEVASGYRHSHLSTNINEFSPFCLGHTPNATNIQDLIADDGLDIDKFFIALVQLKSYVAWESKSGGAYIYYSKQHEFIAKPSTLTRFNTERPSNVRELAYRVLSRLTPDDFSTFLLNDSTVNFVISNSENTQDKIYHLICTHWFGDRYSYNTATKEYVSNGNSSNDSYRRKKAEFQHAGSLVFKETLFNAKIIDETNDSSDGGSFVSIPSPEVFRTVHTIINSALNSASTLR